ncbi:MAG: hypothetical protein IJD58_12005 [Lachnospiraceae bacterium]|nr:hypothetical protein [Lachnospiraceae bacterium]
MIKALFIGMFCVGCISCDNSTQPVREVEVEMHNWECRYIIHDAYNQDISLHYVDDYTCNIDNSISFIGEDGLVWRIPYPYYAIEVNPKLTQCE